MAPRAATTAAAPADPASGAEPVRGVEIPPVGKLRAIRLPPIVDVTLDNGLRVLVVRRRGIPRLEARLVVPTARGDAGDAARSRVLVETILSGTPRWTSRAIAEAWQGMGGGLGSHADAEQLVVAGSCLSVHRTRFLSLFGEVVAEASFPADEVSIERERVVSEIALLRSQPAVVAGDALVARLYGRHPYGWGTPDPEAVGRVRPAALRKLHATRVRPEGGLLVLVGDLAPDAALADVASAFGGWAPGAAGEDLAVPAVSIPGSMLLVDRPGAVQTNVRIGGAAINRKHPHYPALTLAVAVFGGSFTSRLNDNIREQKGYTYGAHARIDHRRMASQLTIAADVGREVTAASLVEVTYELGRMASLPITQAELDGARRYLQGTLAMGIQTQAGLTAYLAALVSAGLSPAYLTEYPAALDTVTIDDVLEAARHHLRPAGLTTVLAGDAAVVAPAVAPLGTVELA